jgi:hypothetical protein
VLVGLVALAAFAWGIGFALSLRKPRMHHSMLAVGGSAVFLAAVLYAGFGWGYKAAFLVLCVPLVSLASARSRVMMFSSVAVLAMIAISSVVVWNTLLATMAGIIAASFALGAGGTQIVRISRAALRSTKEVSAAV